MTLSHRRIKRRLQPATVFVPLLLTAACGDDDPANPSVPVPVPADLAGSWEMTRTIDANTCGLPDGESSTEVLLLREAGDGLEVVNFYGPWGTCLIEGQTLAIEGAETDDDLGCLATLATSGTATVCGDSIIGSLLTAVTFDPVDCDGRDPCALQSSVVLTMLPESPCLERAVFGDPVESPYLLPYPVGDAYPVYQSYCWPCGGHRDQLAYDFTIPIGDPILAARAGQVRAVRDDSPDDGQGEGQHNYVFIEHDDGTAAFYAHLMQDSVIVETGQVVLAGEQIARSGNSGESDEPHLHFGVYAVYPAVEGEDVPVNFRNAEGQLDSAGGLIRWEVYTALAVD